MNRKMRTLTSLCPKWKKTKCTNIYYLRKKPGLNSSFGITWTKTGSRSKSTKLRRRYPLRVRNGKFRAKTNVLFWLVINAPDAVSALIKESKISYKLNESFIKTLFEEHEPLVSKKIQLDALWICYLCFFIPINNYLTIFNSINIIINHGLSIR